MDKVENGPHVETSPVQDFLEQRLSIRDSFEAQVQAIRTSEAEALQAAAREAFVGKTLRCRGVKFRITDAKSLLDDKFPVSFNVETVRDEDYEAAMQDEGR